MIYICIPTHNEQQTVGVVLWKLRQVLTDYPRDYQLLVADDASTDSTQQVLEPYTRVLPLTVIRNEKQQGYAASLEMLLREASRRSEYPKRDFVVTLQADFSEEPDDLVGLVKRMEAGADVAVGTKVSVSKPTRARRWARALSSFFVRKQKWPEGVETPFDGFRAYRLYCVKKAIEERGDRRLLRYDGWAGHAELLRAVLPHARRVDVVDVDDRPDRMQRPRREKPFAAAWQVRAMMSEAEPEGLVPVAELDRMAATAARSRERSTATNGAGHGSANGRSRARQGQTRDRQDRDRAGRDRPGRDRSGRDRRPRDHTEDRSHGGSGEVRGEGRGPGREAGSGRDGQRQERGRRNRQQTADAPAAETEASLDLGAASGVAAAGAAGAAAGTDPGSAAEGTADGAPRKRKRRRRGRGGRGRSSGGEAQVAEGQTEGQPEGQSQDGPDASAPETASPAGDGGAARQGRSDGDNSGEAGEDGQPRKRRRRGGRRGGRGRRRGPAAEGSEGSERQHSAEASPASTDSAGDSGAGGDSGAPAAGSPAPIPTQDSERTPAAMPAPERTPAAMPANYERGDQDRGSE